MLKTVYLTNVVISQCIIMALNLKVYILPTDKKYILCAVMCGINFYPFYEQSKYIEFIVGEILYVGHYNF